MTRAACLAFLVVASALLAPSAARATCMTNCAATLVFPSCDTPIPEDEWPSSQKLSFSAECETCCSPPGGPVQCDPAAAKDQAWSLWQAGAEVSGTFSTLQDTCEGKTVLSFAPLLAPGVYELHAANVILVFFHVKAVGGCTTDADCTGCDACADGKCAPPCVATCKTDADCGPDAECVETLPGCCTECHPKTPMPDVNEPGDEAGTPDIAGDPGPEADPPAVEDTSGPGPEPASDAGPDPVGPGEVDEESGAPDAVGPEVSGADPGTTADTPASGKGGSSGCASGAVPGGAGFAVMILLAGMAFVRRRHDPRVCS